MTLWKWQDRRGPFWRGPFLDTDCWIVPLRLELAAIPLAGPLAPLYVDRQRNVEVGDDGQQSITEIGLLSVPLDHTASDKSFQRQLGAVRWTIARNRFECGDLGFRHALARMFGHCSPHLARCRRRLRHHPLSMRLSIRKVERDSNEINFVKMTKCGEPIRDVSSMP
jgi:hypothetical protein